MHHGTPFPLAFILLTGVFAAQGAFAEKADRKNPLYLQAAHQEGNIREGKLVLAGTVFITQGTFRLTAAKATGTEDAEGYHQIIATAGPGGLVRFRQKKNGRDEYMEGEAERVEYDERNASIKLLGRANLHDALNSASGEYIEYDDYNQTYMVENALPGKTAKSLTTSVFKPRPKTGKVETSAPAVRKTP